MTPLHGASFSDNLDCIKYLICKGAKINAKDKVSHFNIYFKVLL